MEHLLRPATQQPFATPHYPDAIAAYIAEEKHVLVLQNERSTEEEVYLLGRNFQQMDVDHLVVFKKVAELPAQRSYELINVHNSDFKGKSCMLYLIL